MHPNEKVGKTIPSKAGFIAILSHCSSTGPVNLMLLQLLLIEQRVLLWNELQIVVVWDLLQCHSVWWWKHLQHCNHTFYGGCGDYLCWAQKIITTQFTWFVRPCCYFCALRGNRSRCSPVFLFRFHFLHVAIPQVSLGKALKPKLPQMAVQEN